MGKLVRKKSRTQRNKAEKKKFQQRVGATIILIIAVSSLIGVLIFFAISPGEEETLFSPITIYDQSAGEDISWCNVEVFTLTSTATIDTYADLYVYANWELLTEGAANTLSLDMTLYSYGLWIHIDDALGYFESNWHRISGSEKQYNITLYAIHRPSNIMLNNMNKTDLSATIPANLTDETYTMITQFPFDSTNQLHCGTNWDHSVADYAVSPELFTDQADWRSMNPVYNLDEDTYNNYDTSEAIMTSTFAFRFTANDTISIVNGNVNQINITIGTDYDLYWNYEISDDTIYIYSLGALSANFKLEYTMSLNSEITIDSIDSGIAALPGITIDSYSALSTITA